MGVDVSTYRARIGSFVSCCKNTSYPRARFNGASNLFRFASPRPCVLLVSTCLSLLLLCAGDVEVNPGPKIDDVLALMKDFHEETTATLTEIKQNIAGINAKIHEIETGLQKMSQIESTCEDVGDSVREVKSSISKVNEDLVDVVDDINNRMRRNNLIVKGLPETDKEDYEETEKIVKEFFSAHLELQVGDIERAHRVGKRRPHFDRPIIIKFLNFKSKTEVLRNAPKLKNLDFPKVWIDEDFSPKVQMARKRLRDFAKLKRKGSERYSVRFNCLYIWGRVFRYNFVTDSVVEVTPRQEFTPHAMKPQGSSLNEVSPHQPLAD